MDQKVRGDILRRDNYGCVAAGLGAEDICRDRWGNPAIRTVLPLAYWPKALTIDRVKDDLRMGQAAPYDLDHGVTLCWHHHLNGWATAHRPELRIYLKTANRVFRG